MGNTYQSANSLKQIKWVGGGTRIRTGDNGFAGRISGLWLKQLRRKSLKNREYFMWQIGIFYGLRVPY